MTGATRILSMAAILGSLLSGQEVHAAAQAMQPQYGDIASGIDRAFATAGERDLVNLEAQITSLASRYDKLRLWLKALDLAQTASAPLSLAELPELNIAPKSTKDMIYASGMDPKDIKDPDVRKDYEKRLAENVQKAQKSRFQNFAKEIRPRWIAALEAHAGSHYSASPNDIAEIDRALAESVSDVKFRASLRAQLIEDLQ